MALTQCKECGRSISDMAQSCPGCGCPASIGFDEQYCSAGKPTEEAGYGWMTYAFIVIGVGCFINAIFGPDFLSARQTSVSARPVTSKRAEFVAFLKKINAWGNFVEKADGYGDTDVTLVVNGNLLGVQYPQRLEFAGMVVKAWQKLGGKSLRIVNSMGTEMGGSTITGEAWFEKY